MKSFTVTKADPRRFRVLPLIEKYGWDPMFVVNTLAQRDELVNLGVSRSSIVIAVLPNNSGITGVSRSRDFARKIMPLGKWSVWIDDNVSSITGLPLGVSRETLRLEDQSSSEWRAAFSQELSRPEFDWYVKETIDMAERHETIFAAFANQDNFYFRKRKWQWWGYCRTQLALYKNDGSTWFPFPTCMFEDAYKSIDVVARYGRVVINRHVKANKPTFEAGGIGSFKERLPHLQDNCRRLMELYPGLLKYGSSGGQYGDEKATEFHVEFALRSQATIDRWRRDHGFLR